MARELILIRHAKAEWGDPQADLQRKLSAEGCDEATRLGQWLKSQQLALPYVLCSAAVRTQQTWELVAQQIDSGLARTVQIQSQLYLAELPVLLQILRNIPADIHQAGLIGHNPGIEQLAAYVSNQSLPRNTIGEIMATANCLRFSVSDDWQNLQGAGTLRNFFRPQPF